jgi:hypothetical protein
MSEESHPEKNDELRSFIAGTLRSIMNGISDAQPDARVVSAHGTGVFAFNSPTAVSFDIAVTAERTGSKKGGFEVKVLSLGANAGADTGSKNSTVSRIQFTVPTGFKRNKND